MARVLRSIAIAASSLLLLGNTLFSQSLEKRLAAVGDVMIGRRLDSVFEKKGYEWPFEKVQECISGADIAFCNLECPISARGTIIPKEFNFRAKPEAIESLTYAGFDVANLANNHCLDYDVYALHDTTNTLTDNGIKYCGLGEDETVIEKDGIKIAFLGYSTVNPESFDKRKIVAPFAVKDMSEKIKKIKSENDLVVISFHWGIERSKQVAKSQREYAHIAIDSGADLILGHHAHVLQPIEKYKDKYIVYSMGNFVFGCFNGIRESAIFNFKYSKEKIELESIIPVNINGYDTGFQARPYAGKKKQEIIDFLMNCKN